MRPVRIVEPVVRTLTMEFRGGLETWAREHATVEEALRQAGHDACMRGTVTVNVIGADGALLLSYNRADNLLHTYCAGVLEVTGGRQSCSCGGRPSVAVDLPYQYEKTMGWHWSCERCGASCWSRVEPGPADRAVLR